MSVTTLSSVPVEDYERHALTKQSLAQMLREMIRIRRFEEKVEELFLVKGVLVGPSHLYLGQEATAVGVCTALRDTDVIVSTYRCHGHALAKKVPARLVMAELFGKAGGTCKGLGGSMHASIYPPSGSWYATAIVGSGVPIAAGIGLGFKHEKSGRIATVFFGDGATNTGAFHEGTNLTALWKLPVVLVCENNFYAMSTRVDRSIAGGSIAERVAAYGIPSVIVNGNDVLAVYMAAREAAERARHEGGPTFLECRTYKLKGHGVYDKGDYRPEREVREWLNLDPIAMFLGQLIRAGLLREEEVRAIEDEVRNEVEEAVEFAQSSPVLPVDQLAKYVYA